MNLRERLAIGLGVAVLLGGGVAAAVLTQRKPLASTSAPPARDSLIAGDLLLSERTKGNPSAPITIYEFSDFQCPYCRQFWATTLPAIEREYIATGKARLIFVNLPIPQIHANARAAHDFAMCAARQQRFWPTHDLLYRHQKDWEKLANPGAYFSVLADSAAVDRRVLSECTSQHSEDWLVRAEAGEAERLGISGTPAFVINGGLLPGVQPLELWRQILDSIYLVTRKQTGNETR